MSSKTIKVQGGGQIATPRSFEVLADGTLRIPQTKQDRGGYVDLSPSDQKWLGPFLTGKYTFRNLPQRNSAFAQAAAAPMTGVGGIAS